MRVGMKDVQIKMIGAVTETTEVYMTGVIVEMIEVEIVGVGIGVVVIEAEIEMVGVVSKMMTETLSKEGFLAGVTGRLEDLQSDPTGHWMRTETEKALQRD